MVEAWHSAKNQQFKGSFEVIIHHDHCSVGMGTGASNARNTAIGLTSGRRIVIIDADDRLPQNYAQTLWDGMEKHPRSFAGCPVHFISGPVLARFGLPAPGVYRQDDLRDDLPIPVSAMFDRSAWEEVGGYSLTFHACEDSEFWCRLLIADYKYVYSEKTCLLKNNPADSKSHQQVELRKIEAAEMNALYDCRFKDEVI